MNLILLTRPDGAKIRVNVDHISMILPNNEGEREGKSILLMASGSRYGVQETMEEIWDLI